MKQQLKSVLEMDEVQCQHYMELHGADLFDTMLTNLGSPDGELRDELIYRLLIKLLSGQHLEPTQLTNALQELISESLFIFINR